MRWNRPFSSFTRRRRRPELARRNPPALRLESLEERRLLAVTVGDDIANPGFSLVTFTQDAPATNDVLELRRNASNELEFRLNGGAFTNDLSSGTPGIQSRTINQLAGITALLSTGSDRVVVDLSQGNFIPPLRGLTYFGESGANDQLDLMGTTAADTLRLDDFFGAGLLTVNASQIFFEAERVSLDPGANNDSITVLSTAGAQVAINTGAGSGDRVILGNTAANFNNGAGTLALVTSSVSVDDPDQVELLVDDTGRSTAHTINLTRSGANRSLAGLAGAAISYTAGVTTLQVATGSGTDSLNVDFAGGSPIPEPGGLRYFTTGGADALNLAGGTATSATYTALPRVNNQNRGSVNLVSTGNFNALIEYQGLAPIVDLVPAASRTFNGTNGNDQIRLRDDGVAANGRSQIDDNGSAAFESVTFAHPGTTLNINGLDGNDTFELGAPDSGLAVDLLVAGGIGNDTFNLTLSTTSDIALSGGAPVVAPGDVLNVNPTGVTGLNVPAGPNGIVTSTSHLPVEFGSIETTNGVVNPPPQPPAEPFEPNNTLAQAGILGSPPYVTVNNLAITPGDVDFFRYVAHWTGSLSVRLYGAPAGGVLDLFIRDANNNVIASATNAGSLESVLIPVVSQQPYFVQVTGVVVAGSEAYSLEIENFAAPVPASVSLDPASDTGRSQLDNVTRQTQPQIRVLADLNQFGLPVLTPAQAAAGVTPGAAVEVFLAGASAGFATAVPGSNNTQFAFTFTAPPLAAGNQVISAAVRIFDGQRNAGGNPAPATGRSLLAVPLNLTVDTTAPAPPSTPDLLPSSDTGTSNSDNRTGIHQPAFDGTGEANAIVRIFANGRLVGTGVVGPDSSDGNDGNGLGTWEVTIEPLADGTYEILATLEDLAGNISNTSSVLAPSLVIDSTLGGGKPQRPTLDLRSEFDTGASNLDNITRLVSLGFRVTAEPGTRVVIKHGETVIDSFTMPAAAFADRLIDFTALPAGLVAEGVHLLSAEATDSAGNVSDQSEELVLVIDRTAPAPPEKANLLASSDSGMFDNDDVTNKMQPAFTALAEPNSRLRVFGTPSGGVAAVIGETTVGSDLTNKPEADNLGTWEVTVEPLRDGTYQITATAEDLAGNISAPSMALQVVIDTAVPNTPVLDLVAASDSGRSNVDNITNAVNTTFASTSSEAIPAGDAASAHLIKYRIYDRLVDGPAASAEVLVVDSFVKFGAMVPAGLFNDTLVNLAEGVHHLKLEFEDRAGNISPDYLLTVIIDRTAPDAPTIGIDPAFSDTGVPGQPDTFVDQITSRTDVGFVGRAEADAIVQLFADGAPLNLNNLTGDPQVGLTVAVPFDGNDAFPNGRWGTTVTRNLNDSLLFPFDGYRQMGTNAEDVAGNLSQARFLDLMVDTTGPRVANVTTPADPGFDLFAPKPTDSPTPLIFSLDVTFVDSPTRVAGVVTPFVYPAVNEILATQPGNYRLVGDHTGPVLITFIEFVDGTSLGTVGITSVRLYFSEPLADDRYTLTIDDNLSDDAGNRLDGESNGIGPGGPFFLPSGDFKVGGDFVARFTVDSRPEIANYSTGNVTIDLNGNLVWDPQGKDGDRTNRDLQVTLGFKTDALFAGNFGTNPPGVFGFTNGFDKLGAYGFVNGQWRWLIDMNGDNVVRAADGDIDLVQPVPIDGLPIAGNFDGNVFNGDEVGLFDGTTWYFDVNADNVIDNFDFAMLGRRPGNLRGLPIVGDFDGDGIDDIATYDNTANTFYFSLAWNGPDANLDVVLGVPQQIHFQFGADGELDWPVAADMDQDGIDDIGLWNPGRSTQPPNEASEWFFLISNDFSGTQRQIGQVVTLNHPFQESPLGPDLYAQWGDEFAIPLVGNFDPPVGARTSTVPGQPPTDVVQDPALGGNFGFYNPSTSTFTMPDPKGLSGATVTFSYGPANSGWLPLYGDWDGDGMVTVGLYDPGSSTWFLKNSLGPGLSDVVFSYGPAGNRWTPLVGDWDGDGSDGVGFFDPATATWFLKNRHSQGMSDATFGYGPRNSGWLPLVGDWDGNGRDGVGFFAPTTAAWFLKNEHAQGMSDVTFNYGPAGGAWTPLVGDWNDDGRDGVGFYERANGNFFLKNDHRQGMSDQTFRYGPKSPLWNLLVDELFRRAGEDDED